MNAIIEQPPARRGRGAQHPSLTARVTVLETRWEDVIPTLATKADLNEAAAQLRTEMHKMDASITRWMLGVVVGLFVGFAGMLFAQQRSLDNAINRLERKIDRIEQLYAPQHLPSASAPANNGTPPD